MNPVETNITDVLLFSLREYYDDGSLVPITGKVDIPFSIKRVFLVTNVDQTLRGNHAHTKCNQVLIATNGIIDVHVFDGKDRKAITLDKVNKALFIPVGIWNTEQYFTKDSTLLVLCDYIYDPQEYIKDIERFKEWKQKK